MRAQPCLASGGGSPVPGLPGAASPWGAGYGAGPGGAGSDGGAV